MFDHDSEVAMGRRARVMTAAAAALLVAASATYLGLALTAKLQPGMEWSGLDDATRTAVRPLVPGSRVQIAVSVRNPGRVPITLDDVLIETPDLTVDDKTVMPQGSRNPGCCRAELAEPFHPVTLGTSDEALVWLMLRLTGAGTYMPCSYFTLVSFEVHYRVLGMRRTQWIDLPSGVSFGPPCDQ